MVDRLTRLSAEDLADSIRNLILCDRDSPMAAAICLIWLPQLDEICNSLLDPSVKLIYAQLRELLVA